MYHVVERSLLREVQFHTLEKSASLSEFLSKGSESSGDTDARRKKLSSISRALVAWQEEADSLHKQLRVLIHEGQ